MARTLITSALPYINGVKHLGNLIGSQLPLRGADGGTDLLDPPPERLFGLSLFCRCCLHDGRLQACAAPIGNRNVPLPCLRGAAWFERMTEPRKPLGTLIPLGPYKRRWAPSDRDHGPGQGQLPNGNYRPRGLMSLTHFAALSAAL